MNLEGQQKTGWLVFESVSRELFVCETRSDGLVSVYSGMGGCIEFVSRSLVEYEEDEV